MEILALSALLVAVAALVLAVLSLRRQQQAARRRTTVEGVPEDVHGLRQEVAALQAEVADSLRHVSVVRYDAFGDVGGHLSWSVALLDDGGNGVVMTSIHGRSEARTYAKTIAGWSCEAQLSPEEDEAISHARP